MQRERELNLYPTILFFRQPSQPRYANKPDEDAEVLWQHVM